MPDAISQFYQKHLTEGHLRHHTLQAPCPFCSQKNTEFNGRLQVLLNPSSFFHGYFRCTAGCVPGGFALHFARLSKIPLSQVPGYEPDREYAGSDIDYPVKNLNQELIGFQAKLTGEQASPLQKAKIGSGVLEELAIGFNGRYLVYPYQQADGNCYAARCIHPTRVEDCFWYGDERFFGQEFRIFNAPEIERCENGALFLVEEEKNLLPIKQLGFPGIAVPTAADLDAIAPERLAWIRTIFLWVNNNAESEAKARAFATRVGFKVRLIRWPEDAPRNAQIFELAVNQQDDWAATVAEYLKNARAFSPFSSPLAEFQGFSQQLRQEAGEAYTKLTCGFPLLDRALGGLHGINIIGGPPKAGKSAFSIQIATEMALRKLPVIYYDFENGRQKIYLRTLSRLSRLSTEQIKAATLQPKNQPSLPQAQQQLKKLLISLRVVNDRSLSPETMRRHIDFLRHETHSPYTVVVIDSLHKLPFKDISQKRSGIDGWLRQLEAIRDELAVSFLVISELARNSEGQFDRQPHLGSFKGSGDIGYSADNAMVLMPLWDPFDRNMAQDRVNELWLVASREQSPGRVAGYQVDYPYWGFTEQG
ncbi:AAA family ATPase [Desulfobulbus rhabdoformis]|uniref:DnaB-like helicase C-terminal domain-containing protein n=1 Tax=Desulfobulbus rhabdoformis TaxID=34032 RepID=UPI0019644C8C|nr:DnaB-like helicase C-terminal domain-containing protein [Desulfobulbus rhabdoformis]MBM9616221.1 AAA family ATPase [Desulfobulbus rhabdoformis]